jgi:large subunit ribosomal protein L5
MAAETKEIPRLKTKYLNEIKPALKTELGLDNVMQVPALTKIVVNMGVGRATQQRSLMEGAVKDLTIITGQKPSVRKAKKSIATFKLREGNEIGAMVTMRSDRMWEFYDRLVFPEIDYDNIDTVRGMNVTIVTTAQTDDQGRALLRALGFPFRRDGQG